MKLNRISEHVWVYPFEERRDRPNLSYIHGDKWNLVVDAGHSDEHVKEFYNALKEEGFALPDITVITHWHWDHTLGMHAVHGLTLSNEKTKEYLLDFILNIKSLILFTLYISFFNLFKIPSSTSNISIKLSLDIISYFI